ANLVLPPIHLGIRSLQPLTNADASPPRPNDETFMNILDVLDPFNPANSHLTTSSSRVSEAVNARMRSFTPVTPTDLQKSDPVPLGNNPTDALVSIAWPSSSKHPLITSLKVPSPPTATTLPMPFINAALVSVVASPARVVRCSLMTIPA